MINQGKKEQKFVDQLNATNSTFILIGRFGHQVKCTLSIFLESQCRLIRLNFESSAVIKRAFFTIVSILLRKSFINCNVRVNLSSAENESNLIKC